MGVPNMPYPRPAPPPRPKVRPGQAFSLANNLALDIGKFNEGITAFATAAKVVNDAAFEIYKRLSRPLVRNKQPRPLGRFGHSCRAILTREGITTKGGA